MFLHHPDEPRDLTLVDLALVLFASILLAIFSGLFEYLTHRKQYLADLNSVRKQFYDAQTQLDAALAKHRKDVEQRVLGVETELRQLQSMLPGLCATSAQMLSAQRDVDALHAKVDAVLAR